MQEGVLARTLNPQTLDPKPQNPTSRFMGSYKCGYISPLIWFISVVTLLITLLTTTHEPPSKAQPAGMRPDRREAWPRARPMNRAPAMRTEGLGLQDLGFRGLGFGSGL